MAVTTYTLSQIEDYLYGLLRGTVSSNVFTTTPPETLKSTWNDMVVIDLGVPITDMGAYRYGTALIWLYAKPLADGRKNVATMNTLESALDSVIASASTETIRLSRRDTYTDYDKTRNWHVNVVELIIKIF